MAFSLSTLYLRSESAVSQTPSIVLPSGLLGTWDYSSSAGPRVGSNARRMHYNQEAATTTYTQAGNVGTGNSPKTYGHGQFCSPPLKAQSIGSGNWTIGLAIIDATNSVPTHTGWCAIYLMNGATGAIRTTILAQTAVGTSKTAGTTNYLTFYSTNLSGASATASDGDYILVEVGVKTTFGGTSASQSIRVRLGNSTAITSDGATNNAPASFITSPAALSYMITAMYPLNTASDINPGAELEKKLDFSQGSGSVDLTTTTTVGGGAIQVTDSAGGTAISWLSPPLYGVTIDSTVQFNIRGKESLATVNAGRRVQLERTDNAGNVLSTIIAATSHGTEFTTTDAANAVWELAATSTTLANGDRLKLTMFVVPAGGTMAAGTAVVSVGGSTPGAAGDTWLVFMDELVLYDRTPVNQDLVTAWNLRAPVNKDGVLAWNMRSKVNKDGILAWNIHTPVGRTFYGGSTNLFIADFEENNTSDMTSTGGNFPPSASTSAAKNGTYGLRFVGNNVDSNTGWAYKSFTFPATNIIVVDTWTKRTATPSGNSTGADGGKVALAVTDSSGTHIARWIHDAHTTGNTSGYDPYYMKKDGSVVKLGGNGGAPGLAVANDTWVLLRIIIDKSGSNPTITFQHSYDGTSFTTDVSTATDSSSGSSGLALTPARVYVGIVHTVNWETTNYTADFDDISVSDGSTPSGQGMSWNVRSKLYKDLVTAWNTNVPLFSTLFDNFDDNSIDSALWITGNWGGGSPSVTESSGQINLNPDVADTTSHPYLRSKACLDFTGASFYTEMKQVGTPYGFVIFSISALPNDPWPSTPDAYYFQWGGTDLEWWEGSTLIGTVTYDSTNHRWWRIRESGGTIYFDAGPSGNAFTNLGSVTKDAGFKLKGVFASVSYFQDRVSGNPVIFDNVNVVPYTQVNKDLVTAWNLRAVINKDGVTSWNVRALTNKDLASAWNVRSTANKDLITAWNLRALTNKDLVTAWNLRAVVQKDLVSAFNVRASLNKDLISVWNVRSLANKDLVTAWNLRALANKDLISSWNLRALINKDLTTAFNVRTSLNKDLVTAWNTRALTNKDLISAWNVRAAINKDLTTAFNVRALTNKDGTLAWNVRGKLTKDLVTAWNVRARVSQDAVAAWNVRQITNKDAVLAWNIHTSLNKDLTTAWNLRARISADGVIAWHTRAVINKDLVTAWNVRTSLNKDLVTAYNVRALANKDLVTAYNVRSKLNKDLVTAWNIHTPLHVDLDVAWNIRKAVGSQFDTAWDVIFDVALTPVNVDFDLAWKIRALTSKDQVFAWNVRSLIQKDAAIAWNTRARVNQSNDLAWNVRSSLNKDLNSSWNVRSLAQKNFDLAWNVRAAINQTLNTAWNVRTSLHTDLSIAWNLRARVTKDGTILWSVRTLAAGDLPIAWNVRTSLQRDISVAWNTRGIAAKSGNFAWNIRALVGISFSSAFHVRTSVWQQFITSWATRFRAANDVTTQWNIRSLTNKDFTTSWHTRALVQKVLGTNWNVRALTSVDLEIAWNVKEYVPSRIGLLIMTDTKMYLLSAVDSLMYELTMDEVDLDSKTADSSLTQLSIQDTKMYELVMSEEH